MSKRQDTITIRVPGWYAQEYREAVGQKRLKMEILLDMTIRDAFEDKRTLAEVMHDFPWEARARGMAEDEIISFLCQLGGTR